MTKFLLASMLVLMYTKHPAKIEPLGPVIVQPSTIEKIVTASMDVGLPPHIALDRFWHESRWRHIVDGKVLRNNVHDCGIAQLQERFNPGACSMTEDQSIHEGVRQLSSYWNRFHSERLTRIAYVSGLSVALRSKR